MVTCTLEHGDLMPTTAKPVVRARELRAAAQDLRKTSEDLCNRAAAVLAARRWVLVIHGSSGAESEVRPLLLCTECGNPIERGVGRFNVGDRRYHADCYDPTQHLSSSALTTIC
jgi:hypothetical protein